MDNYWKYSFTGSLIKKFLNSLSKFDIFKIEYIVLLLLNDNKLFWVAMDILSGPFVIITWIKKVNILKHELSSINFSSDILSISKILLQFFLLLLL